MIFILLFILKIKNKQELTLINLVKKIILEKYFIKKNQKFKKN